MKVKPPIDDALRVNGPVMLVDDDESYREQMSELFAKLNIPLLLQDSGAHAIRFLQSQPWNWYPALVITDIVMDGVGGYQLIRRITELYPNRNIPIIVISRLDASIDVAEAEVAGASAYLTKPIDEERLIDMLGKVLARERKGMIVFTSDFGRKKKLRRRVSTADLPPRR